MRTAAEINARIEELLGDVPLEARTIGKDRVFLGDGIHPATLIGGGDSYYVDFLIYHWAVRVGYSNESKEGLNAELAQFRRKMEIAWNAGEAALARIKLMEEKERTRKGSA